MIKTYKIVDCLPDTLTNQFDMIVDYDDQDYTVFTTNFFVNELYQHFDQRLISLDNVDPAASLVALFNLWMESRNDAYARRMYALSVDYNPLENYDRMEEKDGTTELTHGEQVQTTHNDTNTRTHNDTDTRTHNNTDTLTYNGSETDTSSVYGVNSAQPVPSDTSTHSYTSRSDANAHTGTIADAHTGTIADAHTGTVTDAHSGKDTTTDGYELHAHGNIGVTTSAQMLKEDIELLKVDIATLALYEFMDRYTWECMGLSL